MKIGMTIKRTSIILLPLLCLMLIPSVAQAATITACTFNRQIYGQGETGYITVTVYNDEEDKIRVTEVTATIDYYYADGNVYIQTFFSSDTLPVEIAEGQSEVFYVPFSLPTNVAPGYTLLLVKAKTELWNERSGTWGWSDNPTYEPKLYIESPYKEEFEEQQLLNDQLSDQLQDLRSVNATTTNIMYLLGLTTLGLAIALGIFLMIHRRTSTTPQLVA